MPSFYSSSLSHHGILGQKWGKRNGPPYPIPSGEHSSSEEKAGWKRSVNRKTTDQTREDKIKKSASKNRGILSDDELKQRIARLKLEKELRELTRDEIAPGRSAVKKCISDIGKDTVKKYTTTAATGAALYLTKAAISKTFERDKFAEAVFNGGAGKKK